MKKQFVLYVEYGTGKIGMLTDTCDITVALKEFLDEYGKALPDSKDLGLPNIMKAELIPIIYDKRNYDSRS